MYIKYNPNPTGRFVEDCAIRAIAKALNTDWETAYAKLSMNGYAMGDMPNANSVWGALLHFVSNWCTMEKMQRKEGNA